MPPLATQHDAAAGELLLGLHLQAHHILKGEVAVLDLQDRRIAQQALAEGQSLAVARDNPYIEPSHVLAAMLAQPDGRNPYVESVDLNLSKIDAAASH